MSTSGLAGCKICSNLKNTICSDTCTRGNFAQASQVRCVLVQAQVFAIAVLVSHLPGAQEGLHIEQSANSWTDLGEDHKPATGDFSKPRRTSRQCQRNFRVLESFSAPSGPHIQPQEARSLRPTGHALDLSRATDESRQEGHSTRFTFLTHSTYQPKKLQDRMSFDTLSALRVRKSPSGYCRGPDAVGHAIRDAIGLLFE